MRPRDGVILRGAYEHAKRGYDHYVAEESEDASFVTPGAPANLFALSEELGGPVPSRYDQAKKDFDRVSALLQVAPGDKVSVSLSYLYARDNYNEFTPGQFTADTGLYGLNRATYDTFSADVDFTPTERVNLYGFYTRENNNNWQRGRQSGATVSLKPIDDWFSTVADKVDSFGGGAAFAVMPQKLSLNLSGQYQKVDGDNVITAPVGGAPGAREAGAGGPPRIHRLRRHEHHDRQRRRHLHPARSWAVTVGRWYEDYKIEDANAAPLDYPRRALPERERRRLSRCRRLRASRLSLVGPWRLPMTTHTQTAPRRKPRRSSARAAGRTPRAAALVPDPPSEGSLTALTVDALRMGVVVSRRVVRPPSIPHDTDILCGDLDDETLANEYVGDETPGGSTPTRPERRGRDRTSLRRPGRGLGRTAHVGGLAGRTRPPSRRDAPVQTPAAELRGWPPSSTASIS